MGAGQEKHRKSLFLNFVINIKLFYKKYLKFLINAKSKTGYQLIQIKMKVVGAVAH